MGEAVDRLGGVLLDAALAGTLLSIVGVLAMIACTQPARRCSLARALVLGLLVLPIFVGLTPQRPRLHLAAYLAHLMPPRSSAEATGPDANVSRLNNRANGRAWSRGLTVAYLGGVSLQLGWLGLGWLGVRRSQKRSVEPAAEVVEFYESLSVPGLRRRPRPRVSAKLGRPVLLGVARPALMIPSHLDHAGPEDEALRLGLLHELAHAARLDPQFSAIAALTQAFWFFLPTCWWIQRQRRLDQEFLADQTASELFGPPPGYASSLVGFAARGDTGEAPFAREGYDVGAGGSPLFLRVLMLVRCPFPVELKPPLWWRVGLMPAVVVLALLSASFTLHGRPRSSSAAPLAPTPTGEPHGKLSIARLSLDPRNRPHDAPAGAYSLPIPLPGEFFLTLEVWASQAQLATIRIAGYRLAPADAKPEDGPDGERWRHVRLERDFRGARLAIDGRTVPLEHPLAPPTHYLTLQPPPGQPGLFRNLQLAW